MRERVNRLIQYRTVFYYLFIFILVFQTALLRGQPVSAAGEFDAHAKYLVLIVVDGCRPDYLSLVETPNIDVLKAAGTWYSNSWVGQMSNDTPASHATISTGCFPRNNDILSFGWRETRFLPSNWELRSGFAGLVVSFVKATGWIDLGLHFQQSFMRKAIEKNYPTTWQNVTSGVFNSIIRESGAASLGALYKKLHPGAKIAAVGSDKWYAVAAMAADSADIAVFADSTGVPPITFSSTKDLKPAGLAALPLPAYIQNDPAFIRTVRDECDVDTWATDVSLRIIEEMQPEILLVNLPATDDIGHTVNITKEPGVVARVIANADKQIGRIIDAYRQSGKFDDTLFVVLSDHGMTPVTATVSQTTLDRIYVESGNLASYTSHVYLLHQDQARDIAEKITGAGIPGLHGAYYRVQSADGGYSYEPTSSTAAKITGDADKAYRYLLSTFAGERSPDIELITAENWHVDFKTGDGKIFYSNHDSATWGQQYTILLFSGPGVNKGIVSESPARLLDVAPTILSLLGIEPESMDGIPLADALQSPSAEQVQVQFRLNGELVPLIKALESLSHSDIHALNGK